MDADEKRLLSVLILAVGVVVWLTLTVYPFGYGWVESSVLVGILVLLGFVEFVLDEALVSE